MVASNFSVHISEGFPLSELTVPYTLASAVLILRTFYLISGTRDAPRKIFIKCHIGLLLIVFVKKFKHIDIHTHLRVKSKGAAVLPAAAPVAFPGGFEPSTFRLGGGCSILLSYGNLLFAAGTRRQLYYSITSRAALQYLFSFFPLRLSYIYIIYRENICTFLRLYCIFCPKYIFLRENYGNPAYNVI